MCFDVFQLMFGIVDEGGQFRPFPGGECVAIHRLDFIPDYAGAVVENVGKGLVLPMDIAHKMLGSLGQRQNGLQIDEFGANFLHRAKFLGQKPQIPVTVIKMFHCSRKYPFSDVMFRSI